MSADESLKDGTGKDDEDEAREDDDIFPQLLSSGSPPVSRPQCLDRGLNPLRVANPCESSAKVSSAAYLPSTESGGQWRNDSSPATRGGKTEKKERLGAGVDKNTHVYHGARYPLEDNAIWRSLSSRRYLFGVSPQIPGLRNVPRDTAATGGSTPVDCPAWYALFLRHLLRIQPPCCARFSLLVAHDLLPDQATLPYAAGTGTTTGVAHLSVLLLVPTFPSTQDALCLALPTCCT